ncbi:MAG: hypothetical protein ABW220_19035 [Burkholderiaceae bacterium]
MKQTAKSEAEAGAQTVLGADTGPDVPAGTKGAEIQPVPSSAPADPTIASRGA